MIQYLRIRNYSIFITVFLFYGCAYFNTFYNAKQYYEEAEKLRLEKDGESIPITAMDKYAKTIKKCQTVISDFPKSKYVIEARLLMSKARYYRSDLDIAISDLGEIQKSGTIDQKEEAKYWKALCKWKKGSVSAALNELDELLKNSKSRDIKSKCYLSLAEIAQESTDLDMALSHLKNAANLTTSRSEKGVIYGRLSEMAFSQKSYELARTGYENVISYSLSKEKIEKAHLQILKILRMEKKYKSAQKKIKSMLLDDKFSRISGNLELELVQIYKAQNEISEIENRLETIVNNYQRTAVSAEAYFQLGKIYSSEKWNLEKAKEYFEMVSKEYNRSIFSAMAKNYINAIDQYQKASSDLKIHEQMDDSELFENSSESSDSTKLYVSQTKRPDRTVPEIFYQLADLEAFTFNRYNQSILYLEKIINEYEESDFRAKAIFSSIFVYQSLNDSASASIAEENLLKEYPSSDYSMYISNEKIESAPQEQEKIMIEAELNFKNDNNSAIKLYKTVLKTDSLSNFSVLAAYAVAYFYDQETVIDSALKYYTWIKDKHPLTEQSIQASMRINSINFALSSLNPDSSTSIIQEEN